MLELNNKKTEISKSRKNSIAASISSFLGFHGVKNDKQSVNDLDTKTNKDNSNPIFVNIVSEKTDENTQRNETNDTYKFNQQKKELDNLFNKQEREKKSMLVFCRESLDKSSFINARESYLRKSIEDISNLEREYHLNITDNSGENLFENNRNYISISESPLKTISEAEESDSSDNLIKLKMKDVKFKPYMSATFPRAIVKPALCLSSSSTSSSSSTLSIVKNEKKRINEEKFNSEFSKLVSKLSLSSQTPSFDLSLNFNSNAENLPNDNSVLTTIITASKTEKPSMTMMQATSTIVKSARFSRRRHENDSQESQNSSRYISVQNSQPIFSSSFSVDSFLDEGLENSIEVKSNVTTSDISTNCTEKEDSLNACSDNTIIAFSPFSDTVVEFPTTTAQQPLTSVDRTDRDSETTPLPECNNYLDLLKKVPVGVHSARRKSLVKNSDVATSISQKSLTFLKDVTDMHAAKAKHPPMFFGSSKALINRRRSSSAILLMNDSQVIDSTNFTTFVKPIPLNLFLKSENIESVNKESVNYYNSNSCNSSKKYSDFKNEKMSGNCERKSLDEKHTFNIQNENHNKIDRNEVPQTLSTISYIKSFFKRRSLLFNEKNDDLSNTPSTSKSSGSVFQQMKKLSISSLKPNLIQIDDNVMLKKIDYPSLEDADRNNFINKSNTMQENHYFNEPVLTIDNSKNIFYNNDNCEELKSRSNNLKIKLAREESFFSENDDFSSPLFNIYNNGKQ